MEIYRNRGVTTKYGSQTDRGVTTKQGDNFPTLMSVGVTCAHFICSLLLYYKIKKWYYNIFHHLTIIRTFIFNTTVYAVLYQKFQA